MSLRVSCLEDPEHRIVAIETRSKESIKVNNKQDIKIMEDNKEKEYFNIFNTNVRSIGKKMDCFIEYLEEMRCSQALVTETWLSDGS